MLLNLTLATCGVVKKGCQDAGSPHLAVIFHALLTSAAPLAPALVGSLWTEMAGDRSDDAGAKVEPYDPAQMALSMC
jgi:hypothetical protein